MIVPFPVACGHCFYCEHDQYSQCDNSNPYGEIGGIIGYSNTFGGYRGGQAEYLRVPFANVGPRVIPEHLTDEQVLLLTIFYRPRSSRIGCPCLTGRKRILCLMRRRMIASKLCYSHRIQVIRVIGGEEVGGCNHQG